MSNTCNLILFSTDFLSRLISFIRSKRETTSQTSRQVITFYLLENLNGTKRLCLLCRVTCAL